MSYSQEQIDNFWFGNGGSADDVRAGAYCAMSANEVAYLTTQGGPGYDADFSAILAYLYREAVINKSGVGPTGVLGFYSESNIGGVAICAFNNAGLFNGPMQS